MGFFTGIENEHDRSIVRKFDISLEGYVHKKDLNVLEKKLTIKDELNMSGNVITDLGEPKNPDDATSRRYVYTQIQRNTRELEKKTKALEDKTKVIEDSVVDFRRDIEGNVRSFIEGAEERIKVLDDLIEENNNNIENVRKTIEECLGEIIKLEEDPDKPDPDDECGLVKSLKIQKEAIKELREANERNSDIRRRVSNIEKSIKTILKESFDGIYDILELLRTDYVTLIASYNDLSEDVKTLTSNQETLTNKESDDYKDLSEKYNNLIILHNNLKGRHDALDKREDDNNKQLVAAEEKLERIKNDLDQLSSAMSIGNDTIRNDLKDIIDDLVKYSEDLDATTLVISDINLKTNLLENGLRNQRTDFDNHIKYAERLKDLIDNIKGKVEKFSFLFEKYKILLFESEFINKTVNIYHDRSYTRQKMRHRGEDEIISIDHYFSFYRTNVKEYFNNFSFFSLVYFLRYNRIRTDADIDLVLELRIDRMKISPTHPDYIGGFIFNTVDFAIYEFIENGDKIERRNYSGLTISRDRIFSVNYINLHLKADRDYSFNFFNNIVHRVDNHKDESYDIDIDFTLRFFYTTDVQTGFSPPILLPNFITLN